jgi:hypothetical protein
MIVWSRSGSRASKGQFSTPREPPPPPPPPLLLPVKLPETAATLSCSILPASSASELSQSIIIIPVLQERKRITLFECFRYVCPEPVLVNRSHLYMNGAKLPFYHLLLPPCGDSACIASSCASSPGGCCCAAAAAACGGGSVDKICKKTVCF